MLIFSQILLLALTQAFEKINVRESLKSYETLNLAAFKEFLTTSSFKHIFLNDTENLL